MDTAIQFIFIVSLLLSISIFAGIVSTRIGAPLLLVFLMVGMLSGENGPGGIVFNDMETAYVIGSLSLAVILFDGGLRTPMGLFRKSLWPAVSLSTVGVLLTAAVTSVFAVYLFGVDWMMGLLIGAILSSTDAAAVFLLLYQRGVKLKERVRATLEVESGINDPMAFFLTISLVEALLGYRGGGGGWHLVPVFFWHMGIGVVTGYAGGKVLGWLANRLPMTTGLYPILVLSGSLFIFSGTALIGGSGFLAVYLAGLVVGNTELRNHEIIIRFYDGIAWLAQMGMFIMIGLLVTPLQLWAQIVPACLMALALIFLARPIAVWLCLVPFNYSWQEKTFVSWVGLRGAVPIFLAIIPTLAGLETDRTIFNIAFVVVVISLVLQGWTVNFAARALKLTDIR